MSRIPSPVRLAPGNARQTNPRVCRDFLAWHDLGFCVFLSGYGDVQMTVQAMKGGAVEFLTKPVGGDVLLSAIQEAIDRSSATLHEEEELQALRSRYASLTVREREVMALVVAGLLNKQVAGELGISEITVKAHRGQMMRKMKAPSLPHLVKMVGKLRIAPAAQN